MNLEKMISEVYEANVAAGWRDNPDQPDPSFCEAMMLLLTEIAEAADAWRRWGLADMTGKTAPHGQLEPFKPEGVGSEFADILIRLLDDAHLFGISLDFYAHRHWTADCSVLEACYAMTVKVTEAGAAWDASARGHALARRSLSGLLRQLESFAEKFGIDLEAEYERKMAYNRTRPYRHGNKRM